MFEKMRKYIFILMLAVLSSFAMAEVNDTLNDTNSGVSANLTNSINETFSPTINISNFFPKTFNLGDSQINIEMQNTGNKTLKDIIALITGQGFSTYEMTHIDSLNVGDKSYIILNGNFREIGNITLTMKIMQETFYQNVTVINPNAIDESAQEKKNREKAEMLNNLNAQLSELEKNYTLLESEILTKKNENYDVSQINLGDLKSYIRNTESNVLSGNADSAKVNFQLALEEYNYQKNKLDNSPEISSVDIIKSYALIFTTLAGAFIMIFTLYELLKKKSERVVSTIGSVKGKFRKREDKKQGKTAKIK